MNTASILLAVAVLNEIKDDNIQLGEVHICCRNLHTGTVGPGKAREITIILPREDGGI